MPDSTYFSRRLREARQRIGLSQKALGVKAGIDPFSASPRMNQYEKGKHLPDLLMMEHLANATGVPVAYFFAQNDCLAELLLLWSEMDEAKRSELLIAAKNLVGL
ncbi:helix-turn-helix domain-containing protein [Ferribacterium limneticum]|uniref:helix-turn-helix domain-containing protein n=1 Tax=Ferribacterium limneticum TaxID=76259 RepID=UPI001CF949A9|nr:helix-turn-helix transcriptional regulator [Ferribacterium limneticum]UCV27567.1 helix-turn-helix transcriptional regulator [Ferribacterium limneticum]UCV31484.1 helix-turn-helix transcriptional regulator [Ferribacterium limneticum]